MTPQEYIDRERRRAWTNLKRANERKDEKAAERLVEKLEVLKRRHTVLSDVWPSPNGRGRADGDGEIGGYER